MVGCGACTPRALDDWLRCGDCLQNERALAADVGLRGVAHLGRALRGLSTAQRANLTRQFRQSYRTIARYRAGGPAPPVTEAVYVAELLANADATYRQRAATALGDISARSRAAAMAAQPHLAAVLVAHALGTDPLRDDVLRSVEAALAVASYPPFSGGLRDTTVSFLDTVTVVRDAASLAWDTSEVDVTLPGSPFPDVLRIGRWADSIRFLAVGRPGQYAVVLSSAGPGGGDARVPLTITALRYVPSDSASAPTVAVSPDGIQRFMVVRAGTADHVRWTLSDTTSVALRLEWRAFEGVGPIDPGALPFVDVDLFACGRDVPVPPGPTLPGDFPVTMLVRDPANPRVTGLASLERRWTALPPGCWVARVAGAHVNALGRLLARAVP